MKCVLVFNQSNDIVFSTADKEFSEYINRHALGLQLIKNDQVSDEINNDVMVQVFSPLVTSQQVLVQNRDAYKSVKTENGLIFVLQEYSGYLFLAASNEKEESEAELQRKLAVFHSLLQFLFGPILEELRLDTQTERDARWHFISKLLTEWSDLRANEQAFLVEAVEQLQVNSDMKYKCVHLLEEVGHKLQGVIDEEICHLIFLVNTKQLALYSKSSDRLEARDILMMMLLSQVLHGDKMNQSDNTSDSFIASETEDTSEKCNSSPPSSPLNYVPIDSSDSSSPDKKNQFFDLDSEKLKDTMMSTQEYQYQIVFLQTSYGLVPHTLHSIHIMGGVVLFCLCQPKQAQISGVICQALDDIVRLQTFRDFSKRNLDNLDTTIRKILDFCKKNKNKILMDKIIKDLQARWDSCKNNGLFTFFRTPDKDGLDSRLENALINLGKNLKELFCFLFLHPGYLINPINDVIMHTVVDCQAKIRFRLADYKDYLMVKAQRNYAITSYIEKVPGLVHFIYIDRNRDVMVAPSINIVNKQEEGKFDTSIIVKNKIWSMVNFVQGKLQQRFLSMNWKDGDFFFSYYLWFEDRIGSPLEIKNLPQNLQNFPLPGIMSGAFYKSVVNSCFPGSASSVTCQELMCIHIGLVNSAYVMDQIPTLLNLVYEMLPKSPIGL